MGIRPMTTATGYTLLFESGEGDGYWTIEEDPEGLLCLTSNAETRRVIDFDRWRGLDIEQLRSDLVRDGVPAELIERMIEQGGY